jgi:hypothetical protein
MQLSTVDRRTGETKRQTYTVKPVLDNVRLVGWSLRKQGGEVYDLPADLSSCDCADACFHPERPGGCKHRRALAAGLKALAC